MKRTDKIESFSRWFEVVDYESDEFNVDLIGIKGDIIGSFYYVQFTKKDFNEFKNNQK